MSEQTENTEGGQEQVQELSPVETQAIESGWVPKEEFQGEEHKWVPADEFLRRGELFRKIESQSKELKDVKKALVEMKNLHSKVKEVEYQRALDSLKAQKKTALEEGDADAVIAAEERIDLVKEEQRKLAQEPQQDTSGEENPVFVDWKEKNNWYVTNRPMQAFADALGQDLAKSGLSPAQVLKRVEEEVRKEFPTKFRNANQSRSSSVEGSAKGNASSGNSFQLSPEERKIMHTFVRTGVMTEDAYVKELKRVKGV